MLVKYTYFVPRNDRDWYAGRLVNHTAEHDDAKSAQRAADYHNNLREERNLRGRLTVCSVHATNNGHFFKEWIDKEDA